MPSTTDTLAGLLIEEDEATIYNAWLAICQQIGLPVTSWQPGDPTRSLGIVEAQKLEELEGLVSNYVRSGFLDFALGQWLIVLAKQQFNVDVPQATFATTQVTLTNTSGFVYIIEPGDLTLSASSSGATYHNTSGGTLNGSGGTLSITVVADQSGSGSSAGATEINTLQTALLGVTCSNPAAAIGTDVQQPSATIAQCRNKLGSLSPNGPASAYDFVANNPTLTGIQTIVKSRTYDSSETGDVTIYVASASGTVGGSDVDAVQNAINKWSTPLTITPTVLSANPVTVAVTYTIWIYSNVNQSGAQIQTAILTALENFFSVRPIGGDIIPPATTGALYASMIESLIGSVFPNQTFRVSVSLPASDVPLGVGDVLQLGAVTPTVNLIPPP